MTVDELEARESIRDLVARYNANADSGRFEEVLALFTVDAVLRLDEKAFEGRESIAKLFERTRQGVAAGSSGRSTHLRHFTSTHQIDLIDGDHATGRCYFQVLMPHGLDHWGRYLDDYVRTDGRWYFAARRATVDGRVANSVFP